MTDELGFIMLRHVNSAETNRYWLECYQCIRRLYPTEKIIIIDDHSKWEYIGNDANYPAIDIDRLTNCEVIRSEFPAGRGEILPFYYYNQHRFFQRAIILQDSMFLQMRLNDVAIRSIQTVQFLWNIDHVWNVPINEIQVIENTNLYNKEEVKRRYQEMEYWLGCFGACCVITAAFLQHVMDKYNMESFVETVHTRESRCSFERIFGLICCMENPLLRFIPSIYGHIQDHEHYYQLRFHDYIQNREYFRAKYPIVKVWSGR